MRFTGSFHTMVIHGVSGATSCLCSGRSTSAGAAVTCAHLLVRRSPVWQRPGARGAPALAAASSTSGHLTIATREVMQDRDQGLITRIIYAAKPHLYDCSDIGDLPASGRRAPRGIGDVRCDT